MSWNKSVERCESVLTHLTLAMGALELTKDMASINNVKDKIKASLECLEKIKTIHWEIRDELEAKFNQTPSRPSKTCFETCNGRSNQDSRW
jgi:hypothetical protein